MIRDIWSTSKVCLDSLGCKKNLPFSLFEAFVLLNSTEFRHQGLKKPAFYASLLQICTKSFSFFHGLQLHSHIIKSGLDTNRFVGNSLLALYFKLCPDFSTTRLVFDTLPVRDVISWTSVVSGYVRVGEPAKSLQMFTEMVDFGVEPNGFTLSAVIKACSDLGDVRTGRCFHGMVLVHGFGSNHVISSALVDMYGRQFALKDAHHVFSEMLAPDAICWTSMISTFTRNDRFEEALGCFYSMMRKNVGLFPDEFTFGTILAALGNLGRARQGKQVHAKVITSGLQGNVVVESSTVDMYAKCGLICDSRGVFDRMTTKNAVSWCALLGGYCQSGNFNAVISLFREMNWEGDCYSFGTLLRACAGLAAVRKGKEVHCQYLRLGRHGDVVVESALVDFYAKCGLIDCARRVFIKISARSLISWNAMICGFAQNGHGVEAAKMFDEMVQEGITPDYISFVAVLFACSHAGLVDEGRKYFRSMTEDYSIRTGIEHCNCMVDLLSRVGLLEEAEDLINNSEYSNDPSLWAALLGACATHSDSMVGERAAKKMIELEPSYHLSYVLLANVYKKVGRWDEALEIRKLMKRMRAKKGPGKSWIEIKSSLNDKSSNSLQEFDDLSLISL
ncbi:TPR-like protein [Dioscorea alata]|uniref:TPR-like protein n=1 Tax=Dioscorea alata TaxID=55571 RepID=A0ACB7U3G5_DIOAL|nr:TPR-like protein [Dioscorea alata]